MTASPSNPHARLGDLDAIEVIERRAYPTPWSRSMFARSSRSRRRSASARSRATTCRLSIISRYVDAWHVMNVAVDPDHRRRGSRRRCSSGCSS